MKISGVHELAEPTIAAGESWQDFVADKSAFEDYDVDAAAAARLRVRRLGPARHRAPDRRALTDAARRWHRHIDPVVQGRRTRRRHR